LIYLLFTTLLNANYAMRTQSSQICLCNTSLILSAVLFILSTASYYHHIMFIIKQSLTIHKYSINQSVYSFKEYDDLRNRLL